MLFFRGQANQQSKWNLEKKMQFDMRLLDEVNEMYKLVNKLFIIAMRRGLRLVMENPYSEEHFLRRYWCYPAKIIDKDRRNNGDYFKKPTQYWFLNIEPKNNFIFEAIEWNAIKGTGSGSDEWQRKTYADVKETGARNMKEARSMIHPTYANRFIRQYLID